jgi:hypothetical protein
MTDGEKGTVGFKKIYSIKEDLPKVLTSELQSTRTVQSNLMNLDGYEKISYSWVKKSLMDLWKSNKIEMQEVEAGTGTGKMYLWRKKEQETENK